MGVGVVNSPPCFLKYTNHAYSFSQPSFALPGGCRAKNAELLCAASFGSKTQCYVTLFYT